MDLVNLLLEDLAGRDSLDTEFWLVTLGSRYVSRRATPLTPLESTTVFENLAFVDLQTPTAFRFWSGKAATRKARILVPPGFLQLRSGETSEMKQRKDSGFYESQKRRKRWLLVVSTL